MNKLLQILKLLRNLYRKRHFLDIYRNSFVLQSIPKSGTNYFRLVLGNYLYNLKLEIDKYEQIEYDRMHHELFPNAIDAVFDYDEEYRSPKNRLVQQGEIQYTDFLYAHYSLLFYMPEVLSKAFMPKRTVLLYRNPLDYLISRFHYNYKNRIGKEHIHEHPRDAIDELIGDYIKIFKRLIKYHQLSSTKTLLVSYEDLKRRPKQSYAEVLKFLGFPVLTHTLEFSIDASSIKKVRETEKKRGSAIHTPEEGLKGSFVRSGEIGQWKEYLSDIEFKRVKDLLHSNGIEIDRFTIE